MRHREAHVEEAKAPSKAEYDAEIAAEAQTQSNHAHHLGGPLPTKSGASAGGSGGEAAPAVDQKQHQASVERANTERKEPIMSSNAMPDDKPMYEVETLVVVSKLKQFIRERSGMNTSQCLIDAMTQKICQEALNAIEKAQTAGRKTVMGRDIAM